MLRSRKSKKRARLSKRKVKTRSSKRRLRRKAKKRSMKNRTSKKVRQQKATDSSLKRVISPRLITTRWCHANAAADPRKRTKKET